MVQFNFSERTIKAKVVYYGPPQSGKTTNLEQIHRISDPEGANRLISLNTAQDRTLFFDLLPFSLGAVSGYDFQVQLYTVPGQVQYNATRRVVLAGGLGMVFLGERPSPWSLAGALVVIAAVYVAIRAESPRKTRPATVAPRGTPADQIA